MKTRAVTVALGLALVASVAPSAPAVAKNGERCGAVTIEERPRGRSTSGDFDWSDHQDAHNWYLWNRPHVFASGYLSGNHYYVGFTQWVCRHLSRIRSRVDERWRFRAFVAEFGWSELKKTQRCVAPLFEKKWLRIGGSDIDVFENQVIVWLRKKTEPRKRYIRRRCPVARIVFYEGGAVPA